MTQDTQTPSVTETKTETATDTPVGTATETTIETTTETPVDTATDTPVDTATETPVNTDTETPTETITRTAIIVTPTITLTCPCAILTPTFTATPTTVPTVQPEQAVVYPCPAQNSVTVSIKSMMYGDRVVLTVYTSALRKVLRQEYSAAPPDKYTADVSKLSNGTYALVIEIYGGNNRVYRGVKAITIIK
jgi:hypothetical protein